MKEVKSCCTPSEEIFRTKKEILKARDALINIKDLVHVLCESIKTNRSDFEYALKNTLFFYVLEGIKDVQEGLSKI